MIEREVSCALVAPFEGLVVQKDAVRLLNVVPVALHVEHCIHAVMQARVRRTQAALFDHLVSHSGGLIRVGYYKLSKDSERIRRQQDSPARTSS